MQKNQTPFLLLLFALLLTIIGCVPEPNYSGWVVDDKGQAIVDALISVNGSTVKSKKDGRFELAVPQANTYLLGISHPNFADLFYTTRERLNDQVWTLARAHITEVDAGNSITLVDERPDLERKDMDGAVFTLPPNALVDEQGNPPSGPVRAAIATLDLANGEGPIDWGIRDGSGQEGFLVSYGAVYIQFSNTEGTKVYQIKNGMSGQLSLPVLPSMAAHVDQAPSAPFWYFDETDGLWYKAGDSVYDPVTGAYRGNVNHLSTINTDIAKTDAACLAITKDASIPNGFKLRIRYHSGGTPFGQVPMFVMNDALNAAWRLPANTNVLLELLNTSDEVLGNMVVEDPAGTPLINTVVNTGPPIPTGNTLWPPAPFTDCKPITIKIENPQVEIRINELASTALMRNNPTDDYLTWAPTFGLARLSVPTTSDVNVVLTNDSPNIGGNVRFAPHQSTWPINTTATATSLALTLPSNGSWVPFVIAGEYGTPSFDDKDAIVEARQNTASGAIIGTRAMMVRVRKDANSLTDSERDRFLFAWQKFRNKTGGVNYVSAQEIHRLASRAGNEGHGQPAFLTWHRTLILQVERELQKLDPSVALHYWDWDDAAPDIFKTDFIGASGSTGFLDEPDFSLTNPLLGWDTDLPFSGGEIQRNTDNHTVDPSTAFGNMKPLADLVADHNNYGTNAVGITASFSYEVEADSHDWGHVWPCGGGHLREPSRAAAEPLFYLLHSQIDRQWAFWQQAYNRHGIDASGNLTFPAPNHYDNADSWNSSGNTATLGSNGRQKGSYLEDGLWPWDGTSGNGATSAENRPPSIGTGVPPTSDIPNSTPTIPSTAFPASLQANLWPNAVTIPENRHMIDYLGKFRPQDGLGYCYDDVPY